MEIMEIIKELQYIADRPHEYAGQWKEKTGGKVIGSFCSYAPEEIILAGGALAYRIFGSTGSLTLADAHLQAYSCSLVRGAMADAMDGSLDFLDGVVFPHTCDSIQRLSDIWRLNTDFGFHADVVLPVKLNTESAGEYMAGVFRRFKESLEKEIDREITDENLWAAIDTYNRIRKELERIYRIRRDSGGALPSSVVHTIVKASMVMDRNALPDKLSEAIRKLTKTAVGNVPDKKRLLLSGGICNMPTVYGLIEDAGGIVVWDDLCTGSRYFTGGIETAGDPIEAIARRYLDRAICPAKHSGLRSRAEHLVRMVEETRADGVIFLFLKFCDPHLFDYPYLKTALDEAGIPSLFFEIEEQMPSAGQVKTRCEAFIEML